MTRSDIVVVTPALAAANNGNWQTAQRWARMLSGDYRPRLTDCWSGGDERLMIALHARRSAASIAAWRAAHAQRPLIVVLTGTDLYRDIAVDGDAQRSLALADRLVVLQPHGAASLPDALRGKTRVCVQSSPARRALNKTGRHLRALMVGHLREEKSPRTYFGAARRLGARADIHLDHIGGALEAALADEARALAAQCPNYRWLGALPHETTRRHIQRAHVLVHASRMEGGAQVIIEAVTSGTPVIASRIAGNVGLLGENHPGYFDCGDAAGLLALLQRCRDEPAMLSRLWASCAQSAESFRPERERQTLNAIVGELLAAPRHGDRP